MRVLMVLLALVATPFVVSVSQDPAQSAHNEATDKDAKEQAERARHLAEEQARRAQHLAEEQAERARHDAHEQAERARHDAEHAAHCAKEAAEHAGKVPKDCAPGGGSGGGGGGGCTVSTPPATGTGSIPVAVFVDADPFPALSGWCIQLTGPVTAMGLTDANGILWFGALPNGTYTICEVVPSGWQQTTPTSGASCPTGFGYSVTLADGGTADFSHFGNIQVP